MREKSIREKDIKKIFDACYGSGKKAEKAEVDPERVKASVMEKTGLRAAEGFYTDKGEEPVKPVYAVTPEKKKSCAALRIAAWAGAAACIGAVVLTIGLFGGNGLNAFLPQNNDNSNSPDETFAVTEISGMHNTGSDNSGTRKSMELVFLNGVHFMYDTNNYPPYGYSARHEEEKTRFLYEKDGRLYVMLEVYGYKRTEDITDLIDSGNFYFFSYSNPDNTAYQTHYVIIGGNVGKGDYGYVEFYKVDNDLWGLEVEFSSNNFDYRPTSYAPRWFTDGAAAAAEKIGVSVEALTESIGGMERGVDFKYKEGQRYEYVKSNAIPYYRIKLLNNGEVEFIPNGILSGGVSQGVFYYEDVDTCTPLLYKEKDRIFFTANINGEVIKEDVTDKLTPDDCYIYS
ncbi:MAG: hypothetical protein K2N36_03690, partial [Ruminiclostridium sp.]|nr:hypothetical protein [Ruminiclostridium sp.]